MLIRQEQLDQIGQALHVRYLIEQRNLMRERCPQLVMHLDDPSLLRLIDHLLGKTEGLGFRRGESVLAYLGLAIAGGDEFCDNSKIRTYLSRPTGDPDQKMRWLFERVVKNLNAIVSEEQLRG